MSFTPYLRALCAEITQGCDSALLRARGIYDYITTKTDYRFMRHYCSVDNLSEYCAVTEEVTAESSLFCSSPCAV